MFVPFLAAVLACVPCSPAPPASRAPALQEYWMDSGESILEFSVGFAFSRVKGRFTWGNGTLLYDPNDLAHSSVTVVLDAKSIATGSDFRDEHLRTSDFFDVERFPAITFQSERLERSADGWVAYGPLTMHGVTKQIAIPFRMLHPPARSAESGWMIINVAGALKLARKDFGILGSDKHNSWFTAARNATVADTVDISIEMEAYSADAASQRTASVAAALERLRAGGVPALTARLDTIVKANPTVNRNEFVYGPDYVVRALVADDRQREAEQLSRALVDRFPDNTHAHMLHAYVTDAGGDSAAAEAEYALARKEFVPTPPDPKKNPKLVDNRWWYLDQLARTSIEWGRAREAVRLARTIADLFPATARAHTTYGLALASTGDVARAGDEYAKALSLDPGDSRALEWRRRLPGR